MLHRDLTPCFPVPETEPVGDHLAESAITWRFRLRKLIARVLRRPAPKPTEPFYFKSRNAEVIAHIDLNRDLAGTDLHAIIHEIAEMARKLSD